MAYRGAIRFQRGWSVATTGLGCGRSAYWGDRGTPGRSLGRRHGLTVATVPEAEVSGDRPAMLGRIAPSVRRSSAAPRPTPRTSTWPDGR